MEDAERLAIATEALQEIADDCARCDGTGALTVQPRLQEGRRDSPCPSCEPAREALRQLGVMYA
jgi:hypothetical protein